MNAVLRTALSEAIAAEAASDWARLRRVPSTDTWKAIDHLAGMDGVARAAYNEAVIANAEALFSRDVGASERRPRGPVDPGGLAAVISRRTERGPAIDLASPAEI